MSRRPSQLAVFSKLALLVAVALAAGVGAQLFGPRLVGAQSDPEEVVARIDGSPLARSEYLEYLHREYGPSRIASFLDDWLIRRRSGELGVSVDRPSVEKYVDQKIEREVARLFGGDAAKFEKSLASRRMSIAQYREWQITRESARFLADECILAGRQITSDQVVAKFEELYGEGGVHRRIRHIYLLNDRERAAKNSEDRAVDTRPAEAIGEEIIGLLRQDPNRFGELAARYSDDGFTRGNGGQLPAYRPGQQGFGARFDQAVSALEAPLELSGVIEATRGIHIVQLLARNVTELDSVRDEIESHLKVEAPRTAERTAFLEALRKKARIER